MTTSAFRRRLLPAAVATATGAMTIGASVLVPAVAHASSRFHTSLSIRSVRAVVKPGGQDTISGDLLAQGHALPHRTVTLQDRTPGAASWADEAAASTNRHGRVGFVINPTQTARYRLVYAGTELFAPSHSGVVTVRVQAPRPATALAISVGATTIDYGQSDTVTGTLTDAGGAPLAGDTVVLRHNPVGARKSSRLATGTTDSNGQVTFTVTPKVSNTYRLVFNGTADEAPAVSDPAHVVVRQPSSLSVRLRTRKDGKVVVSGVLTGTGRGSLPGRPVQLQSSSASDGSYTTIANAKTNRHGYVAFLQPAPTSVTYYRLYFPGGAHFTASTSGVVSAGTTSG